MMTHKRFLFFARLCAAVFFLVPAAFVRADAEGDLALLAEAYPGAFEVVAGKGIRFPGGEFIPYDDNEDKDYAALFDRPDLEDMLRLVYPLERQEGPPPADFDPGRFRPAAFFRALYGKDEKEVRPALRPVRWMPSLGGPALLVTTRFGVDRKLEKIVAELEALCKISGNSALRAFLVPPGGSFNYRNIAGSSRLSAHSFGIAVDIAVAKSHYWRWEKKGAEEYKNSIPPEIVEIFERHGFIWGGKWYRFDTMHFEYRPELILKAQRSRDLKVRRPRGQ